MNNFLLIIDLFYNSNLLESIAMNAIVIGLDKMSKTFGNMVEEKIESFNGMAIRNGGRRLIGWFKQSLLGLMDGKLGNNIGAIASFSFWFWRLYKHRGMRGAVIHMKAAQVLLMQATGGDRVKDISELKVRVKRSKPGLPRIIPVLHRRRIMKGEREVIRL